MRPHVRAVAVLVVTVLLGSGCLYEWSDDRPMEQSHVEQFEWVGLAPAKLDLVFVLDDTAASAPYADRVTALLRAVEPQWSQRGLYARPDLHVAVVTADAGRVQHAPSVHGDFLIDEHTRDLSNTRVGNYDGALGDALAALGSVGSAGLGDEPIAATRSAIESLPGLVRTDAYLALVIVSAHDDTSPVAIVDAVGWLKGLEPPAVVGVLGAGAARLSAFVAQFGDRGDAVALDAPDYTPALAWLESLYQIPLVAPCAGEPMDRAPTVPGAQYDCAIELVGEDGSIESEPPCPRSRCWSYRPDPENCYDPAGGRIEVAPFSWPVMPTLRGQCVVAN
jgi:hypothetical protein